MADVMTKPGELIAEGRNKHHESQSEFQQKFKISLSSIV